MAARDIRRADRYVVWDDGFAGGAGAGAAAF